MGRLRKVHLIKNKETGQFYCESTMMSRDEFAPCSDDVRETTCKSCLKRREKGVKHGG